MANDTKQIDDIVVGGVCALCDVMTYTCSSTVLYAMFGGVRTSLGFVYLVYYYYNYYTYYSKRP